MIGYKAFEHDLTCRGFQYEIGKEYTFDGEPIPCEQGFHFCKSIAECYDYYLKSDDTRICKIEALGEIKTDDGKKYCTNKINIIEEITEDWKRKGNSNSQSLGYCNTGNRNTGDYNTGNRNTGDYNTGDCNTGDCNTGNLNTGNRNTGHYNTGHYNTGHYNTGDYNTGDYNATSFSSGVFNTQESNILMFNKPSDWTYSDWIDSDARCLLNFIPKKVVEWVYSEDMTEEEKVEYPTHKTTGGYLKVLDESDSSQIWWDGLSDEEKEVILNIPNFDKAIFEEVVGIKIESETDKEVNNYGFRKKN